MVRKGHTGGYRMLGMILGLAVAFFAFGVTAASAQGGANVAIESAEQGRYIVVFNEDVRNPRGLAAALARQHGFSVRLAYSVALKGFSATLTDSAVAALSRHPRVDYIEADQVVQAFAQTVPTGVRRIFADTNPNITIDGVDDWRIDVDVAVIDTGVADHPDLNVVGRTDCTGGPFNTRCKDGSGNDGNGHGTHVAGSIGALDNGIGVVGVAPGARIHSVKVLKTNGSGWISNIVGGIDWVTAYDDPVNGGIEVANMSLGCECSSAALDQAITNSVAAGVTYAVAAGNSDKDASTFSPANHDDVITVSALADFDGEPGGLGSSTCRTDEDDTLANFSNWGSLVEVTAPGVCILSTWNDGRYKTISGTSMASPHVAGAAALLSASGVAAPDIRQTLIDTGNLDDWTDDSGDGIQEPLLDVSDTNVFAPDTVAGSGGGGEINEPPVAFITIPSDGASFDSGVTVNFTGTASDVEDGDLTTSLAWSSDIDGDFPETEAGGSVSAALSDGEHTIMASVTDSDGAGGSDSITITVGSAPPPAGGTMWVAAIDFSLKGPHLDTTVTVQSDSGPVAEAFPRVELCLGGGQCWDFNTVNNPIATDSKGQAKYKLLHAPSGTYTFTVLDVTHATFDFDGTIVSNTVTK